MAYPADLEADLRAQLNLALTMPQQVTLDLLADSADAIARYCRRLFVLPASAETRRFDAPASALVALDDVLPTPTPQVRLGGVLLTAGTDYQLLPYQFTALRPSYTQIRLLDPATGLGLPWHTAALAAHRPAFGDLSIIAKFAYADPVPGVIARMTLRGAIRLYHQRAIRQGADHGGNQETGRTPVPQGWIEQDDVMTGFLRYYVKDC
jgi:hypothetical protein